MSKFGDDFRRSYRAAKAQAAQGKKKRGFRFWLNIITFVLIFLVLWAARDEIVEAWHLLGSVNIWMLLLIIPVQFASYYASTEIFFTYLRGRGQKQLASLNPAQCSAVALEYNFVNHAFPSAGVSGTSYIIWRLGTLGVSAGQVAMSQIINFIMLGGTFMAMMVVALIWAVIENKAANWIVMATTIAIVALIAIIMFGSYLIGSRERLLSFSHWLTRNVNKFVAWITRGKKKNVMNTKKADDFFNDFFDDYQALRDNKGLLKGPIVWGFISNILDVMLIAVAFWALGYAVNIPILLISFGASAVGSFLVVTPGGVGAYEAVMVGVLAAGGMDASVAVSGVLLARVCLVVGTLFFGWFAYHAALKKYGDPDFQSAEDIDEELDKERAAAKKKLKSEASSKKEAK